MQALLLLLPLLLSIIAMSFVRKEFVKYIALIASVISLVLLIVVNNGSYFITLLSLGGYTLQIATNIAALNLLLLSIVLIIAPLVIFYSFGYMNIRSEQRRFYIEIVAFEAAMLLFAMSYSFITMFIAWEFLSLTSYLLIGFWYNNEVANIAARKAITTVFIGDICILAAMAIMLAISGSLNFTTVFTSLQNAPSAELLVAILLGIAIFTKSAQFPFSEWLPDAMEGPTPVSAFLHSSTMVKAGVFALLILSPIFIQTNLNTMIFYFALITIILATLNALKEKHIKKVIAYSTIQELGLMVLAISGGAVAAGVYFFFAQSFYKVLLFFSSGAVMEATEKTSLDETSGLKTNKLIYITTLFGVLSLAGFIPFDGFFASMGLSSSFSSNLLVYLALNIFGVLTSIYAFRWFFLNGKKSPAAVTVKYLSMPKSIVISMIISAVLTLVASLVFFYFGVFGFSSFQTLSITSLNYFDVLIESILAVIGLLIAYVIYKKSLRIRSSYLIKLINNGILTNEVYLYFVKAIYEFAEGFYIFEEGLSKFLDGVGYMFIDIGKEVRKVSVGNVNSYALILSVGIILLFVFVYMINVV